ncbi:MAG TPA: FkbM family methyltransferase [Terriglobia bacterium]|nr:FkbM family methyltransferase [Terriglobia bacterium]
MKAREFGHLLGFRGKPQAYGFEVRAFDLSRDGRVEYAQWLHPGESQKAIAQETVDELRKFLKPGDFAIDIGAHSGDTAVPIGLAVGNTGCVLALEPNKFVFPVLEKNSQLNPGKTRIVPMMFAATPEDGEFDFEYSDSGFCNGGRHEGISKWRHAHAFKLRVAGKNLESYLRNQCSELLTKLKYIKVDAEGYDVTILKTLSNVIAERRPYIKAEVYKHTNPSQREELYRFFAGHRYAIHRIEGENCYAGEVLGENDLMKWRHFDIFCTPEGRQVS